MTEEEKWEATKRGVGLVRANYRRLQAEYAQITGSRGMVSAWGRVGGSGNGIVRPTQDKALARMAYEERARRMRGWFECVCGTYRRLKAHEGKSPNLWRHQRMLANALGAYVFEQSDRRQLAMMLSATPRPVSERFAERLLREAVREVMADAQRRGLLADEEEERAEEAR